MLEVLILIANIALIVCNLIVIYLLRRLNRMNAETYKQVRLSNTVNTARRAMIDRQAVR